MTKPKNTRKNIETFTIKLQNGQEVKVEWEKEWLGQRTDHLELHGPMTSTGYRSLFLDGGHDRDYVEEWCQRKAQQAWDKLNKGRSQQMILIP